MARTKAQLERDKYKARIKQIIYKDMNYTGSNFLLLDAAVDRQYGQIEDERAAAAAALELLHEWEARR